MSLCFIMTMIIIIVCPSLFNQMFHLHSLSSQCKLSWFGCVFDRKSDVPVERHVMLVDSSWCKLMLLIFLQNDRQFATFLLSSLFSSLRRHFLRRLRLSWLGSAQERIANMPERVSSRTSAWVAVYTQTQTDTLVYLILSLVFSFLFFSVVAWVVASV